MRTLKDPIEVRGYAMFDKFKLRGLLMYNEEIKRIRVAYSYGHLSDDKSSFVSSPFKEHSSVIQFDNKEFDKLNRPLSSKESGQIWEILQERIYNLLNEKFSWFKERGRIKHDDAEIS